MVCTLKIIEAFGKTTFAKSNAEMHETNILSLTQKFLGGVKTVLLMQKTKLSFSRLKLTSQRGHFSLSVC
jgi:hypothetical protein